MLLASNILITLFFYQILILKICKLELRTNSLQLVHLITKEKYKEWKSLVYHGFVRKIVLLKKSNIPIGFNVKNQVVLMIGNNKRRVK